MSEGVIYSKEMSPSSVGADLNGGITSFVSVDVGDENYRKCYLNGEN